MHPSRDSFDEIRARLEKDVAHTLGGAHVELVRAAVENLREFQDHPDSDMLIEKVQQAVHDTFIDPTWPACPRHGHPLWYRDGRWWCDSDGLAVAVLGELAPSPL